jgi:hypothetical protein
MSIDMVDGWAEKIEAAQDQPTEVIGGKVYRRVRYGTEFPNAKEHCRDCAAKHGQYHVVGCCVERCARCLGQAFGCPCARDALH